MILLILGIILVILSSFMAYWAVEKYIIFAIGMGLICSKLITFIF